MASNTFLRTIEQMFLRMCRYEDKELQKKARCLIPEILLELRAQEKMRLLQAQIKKGEASDENISIQDLLLLELLAWFKDSFFKWVHSPECDYCFSETTMSHMSTDKQLFKNTDRVEMHRCLKCNRFTPFFRYENLEILLESREGRCGEWANVFTLLCRAMGWDARYVIDQNDHVWTEVYSVAQKRWLHCDPCENICDNPLIYETGWNKKISYVIAYSMYDIQDVTWRYTADHKKVLQNRHHCSEIDLINTLIRLRNSSLNRCTAAKRKYLIKRSLDELVELMVEKKPTTSESQGRSSGPLTWRLKRGETIIGTPKIWSPTVDDIKNGQMIIRYSSVLDQYQRMNHSQVVETVAKWQNGIFSALNMFRKVEKDWKVVYLCREETATNAEIQWCFDTKTSGKQIDLVTIHFDTKTFESGEISIQICGDSRTINFTNPSEDLKLTELSGSTSLTIKASLKGGSGSCAWQHAQLFRRSLNSNDFPFVVTITF